MAELTDRVAVITGAGRGIGREHALLFAREGAKVVVNDLGTAMDGSGRDSSVAQQVVDEIRALGGEAVANTDSVASWEGAHNIIQQAVDTYGDIHILVNNAGMYRDRTIVNMSEDEFDDVIRIHVKGHFAPLQAAAAHWRERRKAGAEVNASVINTSSASGLLGLPGQVNYASAKAAILAMTYVAARELPRYGVRVNAIAPAARTRLSLATPTLGEGLQAPADGRFDRWHPGNISPLVAYLATADCPVNGHVFSVLGGNVTVQQGWTDGESFDQRARWTIGDLRTALKTIPVGPPDLPPSLAS